MSIWEDDPTRRDLILRVMNSLWERRDSIDLGEIDGAYFWQVCHEAKIRGLHQLIDQEGKGVAKIDACLENMLRAIPYLTDWLKDGNVPRLRDAMFQWAFANQVDSSVHLGGLSGFFGSFPIIDRFWVRLMVFDQSWDGRRVEEELRRRVALAESHDPRVFVRALEGELESVRLNPGTHAPHIEFTSFSSLSIRLCEPGELHIQQWFLTDPGRNREWIPVQLPNIWVTVQMPLPPEGIIAANYDAIARRQHEWNLSLRGSEKNPTNEAAIRSWAVGLLTNDGMSVREAINHVVALMGLGPDAGYSETRFNQDRKELLDRVPEARPFVYKKPRSMGA